MQMTSHVCYIPLLSDNRWNRAHLKIVRHFTRMSFSVMAFGFILFGIWLIVCLTRRFICFLSQNVNYEVTFLFQKPGSTNHPANLFRPWQPQKFVSVSMARKLDRNSPWTTVFLSIFLKTLGLFFALYVSTYCYMSNKVLFDDIHVNIQDLMR